MSLNLKKITFVQNLLCRQELCREVNVYDCGGNDVVVNVHVWCLTGNGCSKRKLHDGYIIAYLQKIDCYLLTKETVLLHI